MSSEGSLFTTLSEAPTIPVSSARILVGTRPCTAFFHSAEHKISTVYSHDNGLTWSSPTELVVDGTGYFSAAGGSDSSKTSLVYVTSSKGIKLINVEPGERPSGLAVGQVLYMHHEETGEPTYPSICLDMAGATHIVACFKRSGRWTVLYTCLSADERGAWTEVDTGEGPVPGNTAIQVTNDGTIHIIYRILVDGKHQLFYRNCNGGEWAPVVQLTFSSAQNGTPTFVTDGHILHAAWARSESSHMYIVYRRCLNGSWWGERRLAESDGEELNHPALSVKGSDVVSCWEQDEMLQLRVSSDMGENWISNAQPLNVQGRFPKLGDMELTPEGCLSLVAAWTRPIGLPWTGHSGLELAKVTYTRVTGVSELLHGVLQETTPQIRFVDVRLNKSDVVDRYPRIPTHRSEGVWKAETDDRLAESERLLEDYGKRLSALEKGVSELRDGSGKVLRELRSQLSVLNKRIEALSLRRPNPADEPRVSPLQYSNTQESLPMHSTAVPPTPSAMVNSNARFKETRRTRHATESSPSPSPSTSQSLFTRVFGRGKR